MAHHIVRSEFMFAACDRCGYDVRRIYSGVSSFGRFSSTLSTIPNSNASCAAPARQPRIRHENRDVSDAPVMK